MLLCFGLVRICWVGFCLFPVAILYMVLSEGKSKEKFECGPTQTHLIDKTKSLITAGNKPTCKGGAGLQQQHQGSSSQQEVGHVAVDEAWQQVPSAGSGN